MFPETMKVVVNLRSHRSIFVHIYAGDRRLEQPMLRRPRSGTKQAKSVERNVGTKVYGGSGMPTCQITVSDKV